MTEALLKEFQGGKGSGGAQLGGSNPRNYEARLAAGEPISPAEKDAYEKWKAMKESKRSMGS